MQSARRSNLTARLTATKLSLTSSAMKYWLMKSEPDVYSIDSLAKDKKTWWENVRNYQARNFMMNDMSVGDIVLFYHSNAEVTGIAGVATVSHAAKPDPTQFEKKSEYFDPKATTEKPRWFCVEVAFKQKFNRVVTLAEIKAEKSLQDMPLVQAGQRLSVQPVGENHYKKILNILAATK